MCHNVPTAREISVETKIEQKRGDISNDKIFQLCSNIHWNALDKQSKFVFR